MMEIWGSDGGDTRNAAFWDVTLCSLVKFMNISEEYVASIFSEECYVSTTLHGDTYQRTYSSTYESVMGGLGWMI